MKHILRICILAAAFICLLLPAAFAAEPAAAITFDKTSVAVGEVVTAEYEITGIDQVGNVQGDWYVMYDEGTGSGGMDYFETTELSGTSRFSPSYGQSLQLIISVEDTSGKFYTFESKEIAVTGDNLPVPKLSITFDKTKVAVGEMITAQYAVTGIDAIKSASCDWMVWTSKYDGQSVEEYASSREMTGSARFIPSYGKYVSLSLTVQDTYGRFYYVESDLIPVSGSVTVAEPQVSITFDQTSVAAGETITAQYSVTGNANVKEVTGEWYIMASDGNSYGSQDYFITTELSGSSAYVPKESGTLQLFITVKDELGRYYFFESAEVSVTGSSSSSGDSASSAPEVSFSFNKTSVAVGNSIAVQYAITGEGEYTNVRGDWGIRRDEYMTAFGYSDFSNSQLSGSSTFTPTFGMAVCFELEVTDSNGKIYSFRSKEIPVTGDASEEPMVSIILDRESMAVGEVITAQYEVTGEGEYVNVQGGWGIVNDDITAMLGTERFSSSILSGSSSFRPAYGEAVVFELDVTDANGNWYTFSSSEVPLSNNPSLPPVIKLTLDKSQILPGKRITARYEVTGEGEYVNVQGGWGIRGEEDITHFSEGFSTSLLSGSSVFCAGEGETVRFDLSVEDSYGCVYQFESDEIRIIALGDVTLVLPGEMRVIEADAFAGSACMDVICPAELESIESRAFANCPDLVRITIPSAETVIADDAFDGCADDLTIVAPAGSKAQQFADAKGYGFTAQ